MKKYQSVAALCMVFALLLLSACGGGGEKEASRPVTFDALETVKAADAGEIKSITYTRYTEGGALSGTVTDQETTENIYLRLCRVAPGRETDLRAMDDGLGINVNLGGNMLSFYFEGNNIAIGDKQYEGENLSSLKSYIDSLIAKEAEADPVAQPQSDSIDYQDWQYYNNYSYYLDNGQLKYWIEFTDQFLLHCMFRSGEPTYYEEVYTLYPDWDAPTAQELTIRTVMDGYGNDISDYFESLRFLFSSENTAIMEVRRDEKTLAGGADDNLLSGEYVMKPRDNAVQTPEQLCRLAQDYYERHQGFYPQETEWIDNGDGSYTIHLYEIVNLDGGESHTATSAWYTVDSHGVGTNDITGEPVDLVNG